MSERWLVISDSHRNRDAIEESYHRAGDVSAVLHAGDETSDAEWFSSMTQVPVYSVAGNWDKVNGRHPMSRLIPVFGTHAYLTHGHQFGVKDGTANLLKSAIASAASVAVYGHTHIASVSVERQVLVINPGSLSTPRGRTIRTYAIVTSTHQPNPSRVVFVAQVFGLSGKPILGMTRRHIVPMTNQA